MYKYSVILLGLLLIISCGQIEYQNFGYGYSQNKNEIYYYNQKISGLDLSSFEILTQNSGTINDDSTIYLKDKNGIYMKNPYIQKWSLLQIKGVHTNSFELIDNHLAKDKEYIYFETQKYDAGDIDVSTLQALQHNYYKDKNTIYTGVAGYSRNANTTIYSKEVLKILEGVDYDTFRIIDDQWAEDKNFKYSYGVKQDITQ